MIDSNPIVCITGQVYASLLGTDAFQETDVINITHQLPNGIIRLLMLPEIPEAIAKAFHIASTGRPGPVLVDITKMLNCNCLNI